jgi:two-component system, NtrC family, nitrogen regulation sensor histidine kinase NtrY
MSIGKASCALARTSVNYRTVPFFDGIPLEKREKRKRRRERVTIILVLIAIVILSNLALKLAKLSSTLPFVNSIFFFGIINLNLILLAVLVFLIFRNLSKLFLERRKGLLGSKLKTKLVLSFLSLSIVPTVVLFLISSLYINSTFDKWFSVKVGNTLQASLEITDIYYKNTQKSAQHFAERVREEVAERMDLEDPYARFRLSRELLQLRTKYALDAVEVYWHPLDPRTLVVKPDMNPELFPRLPIETVQAALEGNEVSLVQHVGTGDVLRSVIPLRDRSSKKISGALTVSYHLPVSLVNKVDEISSTYADFREVNPLKYPVKTIYFAILILITLLVIFAAIWVGLYLARQMTMPLEHLALAVSEVGSGNLNVEIQNLGDDEIATVSAAFNKMITDVRENRDQLQSAFSTLRSTNEELDEKRRYLEAILANVSAGVCSVGADSAVTTINKSAANLLGVKSDSVIGTSLDQILVGPLAELLLSIEQVLEAGGKETIFKYINVVGKDGKPLSLLVTITPLYDSDHRYMGLVLVLDDISHLIKAQREVAWREVARRIAHEIKNPLTPIKLSAQRLQKRYMDKIEENEIFRECTDTIIRQVDELKEMVNEFSQFARFPAANPLPNELNAAIAEVVGLYRQAHRAVVFEFLPDTGVPVFSFDRDQIKRVILNLLDNAVAAMKDQEEGIIQVSTDFKRESGLVTIQVADSGPGIPEDVLPLLFEPYFSTKKEGTGLGLAIAKRIVNDHDGYMRASSGRKEGKFTTFFTLELPVNRTMEVMQHGP